MKVCFYLLVGFSCIATAYTQPLGGWTDHLPYYQAKRVIAVGDKIYSATPYSILVTDTRENSVTRLSKVNGLSETGITTMAADPVSGKLVVAYDNSEIDIISPGKITNLDQLKRSNISADKRILNISIVGEMAYLSTAFGIAAVDFSKEEIKENYIIGNNGDKIRVNGVAADEQYIYAATSEGLKRARRSVNLADYRNWFIHNGVASADNVFTADRNIVLQRNDSLFLLDNDIWQYYFHTDTLLFARSSAGDIVLGEAKPTGRQVIVLRNRQIITQSVRHSLIQFPVDATIAGSSLWIADTVSGLLVQTQGRLEKITANSPFDVSTGEMIYRNNMLLVAATDLRDASQQSGEPSFFSTYANQEWKNFVPGNAGLVSSSGRIVAIELDRSNHLWAASFGGGLISVNVSGTSRLFRENSFIAPSLFEAAAYRVAGLAADNSNNLWIANYGAAQPVIALRPDGSYYKFAPPFQLVQHAISTIIIDDADQKWIISPEGNGLICFNHGQTIENTGDDRWKLYKSGRGSGNLPDNRVLSIAKDKNSFIWVGTANGMGIIQCPQNVFSSVECEAIIPVVQVQNVGGFLFANEEVQAIAVDGANRKWIGTRNGIWLLSPEGTKTIYRFTEDNSPLFSNDVRRITVDPVSGNVYFATAKGICAFRSGAVESVVADESILVFPNPVPPAYNGTIAIRGVPANAIVKITEPDGRLVFQTKALGVQAIWNGRDYRGRPVASGVYLIIVSDEERRDKMIGKIVFLNR
jgi:ligand-binding sensor domain-containing protein